MKIKDVREMKAEELYTELDRLRRHIFDLRSQAVTEKLTNPYQLTAAKRDVARILTVLHERGERDVETKERRFHVSAAKKA